MVFEVHFTAVFLLKIEMFYLMLNKPWITFCTLGRCAFVTSHIYLGDLYGFVMLTSYTRM